MTDQRQDRYYHVLRIYDGHCVYRGESLRRAAEFLAPGTIYGKGPSALAAKVEAEERLNYQIDSH